MRSPSHKPYGAPAILSILTNREKEIVSLVCTGVSNRIIAHNIGVTEGTVKGYLNRIYRKLDVPSGIAVITSRSVETGAVKGCWQSRRESDLAAVLQLGHKPVVGSPMEEGLVA